MNTSRRQILLTGLLAVFFGLVFGVSTPAKAATPPCTELPPTAWVNTPKVNVTVVANWQLDRVPSAKELYLNAMCGAQPHLIWGLVNGGEGAVVQIPEALAQSLDAAVPWLPRADYMYVRGGGPEREVVVVLFTNGFKGPFFSFDQNMDWREEEVRRAEYFWNALPYEFMRRASYWLHDAAKFHTEYTVHTELFGGLIQIPVFTMGQGRALANPMGSMFMSEFAGNENQGPHLWVHELAHYNHYYLSGANVLAWVDEFGSISRRNLHFLGIPIPFFFAELYQKAEGYCDHAHDHQPHGYVTHYARCGEAAVMEDFADTLSIAVGTTQYFQRQVRAGTEEFLTYEAGARHYCPQPGFCVPVNAYDLDYLYDRVAAEDASIMGQKLSFIREEYGFHPYLPQDADGNGLFWAPGMNNADCDDRNPVIEFCPEYACVSDNDCDDGDPCTTGRCAGDSCRFDPVQSIECSADCEENGQVIAAGTLRPCSNACGVEGTETCYDGQWIDCTAPQSCECSPGDVEVVPCGNCGTSTRTCTGAGTWEVGGCDGQGVCAPSATRIVGCGQATCANYSIPMERLDTCSASCQWNEGSCQLTEATEPEQCDGTDNNCNGIIDQGCPSALTFSSGPASPMMGGSGGTFFETNCPAGHVLVGFHLTQGTYMAGPFYATSVINSLVPICRSMSLSAQGSPYSYSITSGGDVTLPRHGPTDWYHATYTCPQGQGVKGINYYTGWYLDQVQIHCGQLTVSGSIGDFSVLRNPGASSEPYFEDHAPSNYTCPGNSVVTGVRTRSGTTIDAIGLNCSYPVLNLTW